MCWHVRSQRNYWACTPNATFCSSVCAISCSHRHKAQRALTAPSGFTLVLHFLTSEWHGANAAQSPVRRLQLGARPEFRKASWHVSSFLQEELHATRCHRAWSLLPYTPYKNSFLSHRWKKYLFIGIIRSHGLTISSETVTSFRTSFPSDGVCTVAATTLCTKYLLILFSEEKRTKITSDHS